MVKDKISYDLFKKKYLLYAIGSINREEFWEFICLKKDVEKFEKRIVKKTLLTPRIKNIMKNLKKLGCELYLATEIPKSWGEMLLDKAGIKNAFKKKFYSSDLLTTKPFAKFYKIVFQNIGKGDIYYIDDTLINLVSAQRLKKHNTVYYNLRGNFSFKDEVKFKINNLNKIIKICKSKK
jgi:FMN phosphatase YigB (HAD superfamily)